MRFTFPFLELAAPFERATVGGGSRLGRDRAVSSRQVQTKLTFSTTDLTGVRV
jgi:hypothetical protein